MNLPGTFESAVRFYRAGELDSAQRMLSGLSESLQWHFPTSSSIARANSRLCADLAALSWDQGYVSSSHGNVPSCSLISDLHGHSYDVGQKWITVIELFNAIYFAFLHGIRFRESDMENSVPSGNLQGDSHVEYLILKSNLEKCLTEMLARCLEALSDIEAPIQDSRENIGDFPGRGDAVIEFHDVDFFDMNFLPVLGFSAIPSYIYGYRRKFIFDKALGSLEGGSGDIASTSTIFRRLLRTTAFLLAEGNSNAVTRLLLQRVVLPVLFISIYTSIFVGEDLNPLARLQTDANMIKSFPHTGLLDSLSAKVGLLCSAFSLGDSSRDVHSEILIGEDDDLSFLIRTLGSLSSATSEVELRSLKNDVKVRINIMRSRVTSDSAVWLPTRTILPVLLNISGVIGYRLFAPKEDLNSDFSVSSELGLLQASVNLASSLLRAGKLEECRLMLRGINRRRFEQKMAWQAHPNVSRVCRNSLGSWLVILSYRSQLYEDAVWYHERQKRHVAAAGDPHIVATVRIAYILSLIHLGKHEEALRDMETPNGADEEEDVRMKILSADILHRMARYVEASQIYVKILNLGRTLSSKQLLHVHNNYFLCCEHTLSLDAAASHLTSARTLSEAFIGSEAPSGSPSAWMLPPLLNHTLQLFRARDSEGAVRYFHQSGAERIKTKNEGIVADTASKLRKESELLAKENAKKDEELRVAGDLLFEMEMDEIEFE